GRHAVAEQVDGDPHGVHQPVGAEQQGDAGGGEGGQGGRGGGEREEGRAGDARHALGGEQQDEHHHQLVGHGHVHAERLGEEDAGDGQVDGGAVQVERVAGGDDQPGGGLGAAGRGELLHDARHHGLGGGGADGQRELVLGVTEELPQVHPGEDLGDQRQHEQEQHRRSVAGQHQHRSEERRVGEEG